MNEARVYADGFERSFAEVKDLLEFLAERGRNAKWIRKPTNTLRLAPLEKEAQNLDAADASMEEILEEIILRIPPSGTCLCHPHHFKPRRCQWRRASQAG